MYGSQQQRYNEARLYVYVLCYRQYLESIYKYRTQKGKYKQTRQSVDVQCDGASRLAKQEAQGP